MREIVAVLFAVLVAGCGTGFSEGAPSSMSGSSGPSSYSQPSSPSEPGLPGNRQTTGNLVVRPDVLTIPFRLRAQGPDLARSLAALEAKATEIGNRVKGATGGSTTVRTTGFSVAPTSSGKSKSDDRAALVDGCVEVPLPAALDYWGRARLVVALSETTRPSLYRASAHDDEPEVDASFDAPHAGVKDPEAFRTELIKVWVKRARGLAAAAQTDAAPLSLVDCAPPAEITQDPISLEEVGLSMRFACRLDTVGGPAPPGRGATANVR